MSAARGVATSWCGLANSCERVFRNEEMVVMKVKAYIDGAARNNPGPAGVGVVFYDEKECVISQISEHLGETTNNVAEYAALIRALEKAKEMGVQEIRILSDSQLLVKQMQGSYQVRNHALKGMHIAANSLAADLEEVEYEHIPREDNEAADELANSAIDRMT